MAEKQLTFEDVNAHIEQHAATGKLKSLAATGANLCSIYTPVRPILVLASQAVFIPQTWRDAIKLLIQVLDDLCPQPK